MPSSYAQKGDPASIVGGNDTIPANPTALADIEVTIVEIPDLNAAEKVDSVQCIQTVRRNDAKGFNPNFKRLEEIVQKLDKVPVEVFLTCTHLAIVMEYAIGGVSYCQFMQICPKDLKLENTSLDDSIVPRLKICDFGNRTKDALLSPEYGLEPDEITCLLLLQACAHLGSLNFGERVHRYVEEHGYGNLLKIRNSLFVMYSRSGSMEKAYRVFCDTSEKNVVTWSSIISGLAMNGCGREAINAFKEMQREGVAPDEQAFTGTLSACSHSGLVDEGISLFDLMRFDYGFTPNVCHYGCMVNLLGRAGLLDRAYNFVVNEMIVLPDATIWRTLLGACRIHKYVGLGERVIEHLIELKAQQAGDYVFLLNIYASAGHWNKVADVRKKKREIQTNPGCTTMELNGKIHEFVADDGSHPRKEEIYAKSLKDHNVSITVADAQFCKPLHVVILKPAFKVFDPGICLLCQ
ncbi:pentatricopeptide repeat-containing protein At3g47530-like [Dendrobium catenatum]|uniref:pentatricopeptide repeat-containing protein At3g47530-like n=1 Tax=Dendrobium catenatum TaxID=906689 RepID=UPI00109F6970|nr:pentatricopeptide repeat-containing protein At3g47530-like [Dendrobium catenatum]